MLMIEATPIPPEIAGISRQPAASVHIHAATSMLVERGFRYLPQTTASLES
jgi:hypothetical protein